jgi:hypothetical protein
MAATITSQTSVKKARDTPQDQLLPSIRACWSLATDKPVPSHAVKNAQAAATDHSQGDPSWLVAVVFFGAPPILFSDPLACY